MGRPINKRYLGNQFGALLLGGYGTLAQTGGSPGPKGGPLSDDDYIAEQKSTNRFKIRTTSSAVDHAKPAFLIQTDHGSFSRDKSFNEFSIDGYKDDGTRVFIDKIYNRTVIYTEGGVKKKAPWIKRDGMITIGSDNQQQNVTITVASTDPISIGAPVDFVANVNVGDTIVIANSADLDGDHVVAGITDASNFTIETLSSGQTSTSALLLKKFPGAIIFDFKNAVT